MKTIGFIARTFLYALWGLGLATQVVPILIYVFSESYRYGDFLGSISTTMR